MEKKVALPRVNASLTPLEFYPDKVTINLQCRSRLNWGELTKGFRVLGFRLSEGQWTYELNLSRSARYCRRGFPALRRSFKLRVSRPKFSAPLNCYIDINPLRAFHQEVGGDEDELSAIPNSLNWLPERVVGNDNRLIWRAVELYIERARDAILELLAFIHELAGATVAPPVCERISAHSIECTIDFRTSNPRQMVTDFMPAFSALLRNNEQRDYRATHVIRPEADLMIHGFVNQSTRLKMYCRTNLRVRFEVQLRPDTFDHYAIERTISAETQTFATLFERCARISRDLFLGLRSRTMTSLNINSSRTPLDLMVALAASTRRPIIMREILECLLRTGSIQNSLYDGKLIATLKQRGILVSSLAHGFSCFSPEYGWAAALLANAQDDHFSSTLRRPFANFNQARHRARQNRRPVSYR